MKAINDLCKRVMKVTDDQLEEVEKTAQEQMKYVHPLKMGRARQMHAIGRHNLAVAQKLRELRDTIKAGKSANT